MLFNNYKKILLNKKNIYKQKSILESTIKLATIAITSVLIIKENILFLEEWIDYHLCLGFDKIYLYDNSKVTIRSAYDSKNENLIPQKRNKHGVDYDKIINLSNNDISRIIENIKKRYLNQVVFIEWSPKNSEGHVCYAQVNAHYDCLKRLKYDNIDWCASIDIDEFIIINNGQNDNIKNYINNLNNNITNIKISERRFDSRFNNLNKLIITINKSEIENFDINNSTKYIYQVLNTYELSVHDSKGYGKKIYPNLDELSFNHYKIDFNNSKNKYKIVNSNINDIILNKIKKNSENYFVNSYFSNNLYYK